MTLPTLLLLACDGPARDRRDCRAEVCNGVDDDCDGLVDDADLDVDDAGRLDLFVDADGDGWGDLPVRTCPDAAGVADQAGDCDDADADVHPGAGEVCEVPDGDCDGLLGAADPDLALVVSFFDFDGDGWGDPGVAEHHCPVDGWVAVAGDCDDTKAAVAPGLPEICDGLDNDCDGARLPDETDGDGDGDPVCTDCDDADPARSSRLEERCDGAGVDEDCDGLVDDADPTLNPYTCGLCPEPEVALVETAPIHDETWNPCLLDPTSTALCSLDPLLPDTHDQGERLHRVSWREDEGQWREDLFLWLPPGPGKLNDTIRRWASYAGFRVVALGFPNEDTLDAQCAGPGASGCYASALYETQYGDDLSPLVAVGPQDAVEGRLVTLLEWLAVVHPEVGFDRYLDGGRPAWDRIVVAGWSAGGAQAAFAAHYEVAAGVVLLSAPKDHTDDPLAPVDWITAPMATPSCALYGTWHAEEPLCEEPTVLLQRSWDAMGMPEATFDLDLQVGDAPPAGTHRVIQTVDLSTLPPVCDGHASVGRDQCLRDEEQLPEYLYLFCAAGDAPDCY